MFDEDIREINKVRGVSYYKRQHSFVATWLAPNKRRRKRFYSIKKFGYDKALQLAIETRMQKLRELHNYPPIENVIPQ